MSAVHLIYFYMVHALCFYICRNYANFPLKRIYLIRM